MTYTIGQDVWICSILCYKVRVCVTQHVMVAITYHAGL